MIHELIIISGKRFDVSDEAIFLPHVEDLIDEVGDEWKRWFVYAFLMSSPHKTNPYYSIPEKDRSKYVREMLFGSTSIKVPKSAEKLRSFIKDYYEKLCIDIQAYNSLYESLKHTLDFLRSIDLKKKNKSGSPLYKPQDVFSSIEKAERALKQFTNLRERVWRELQGDSAVRGGSEIGYFEE